MRDNHLPEPIATLRSFTPLGPDRDAVLFAAGRASVPNPRLWKLAATVLVIGQLATVTLLLSRQDPPALTAPTEPHIPSPGQTIPLVSGEGPPAVSSLDPSSVIFLAHRSYVDTEGCEPAVPTAMVPEERQTWRNDLLRIE